MYITKLWHYGVYYEHYQRKQYNPNLDAYKHDICIIRKKYTTIVQHDVINLQHDLLKNVKANVHSKCVLTQVSEAIGC